MIVPHESFLGCSSYCVIALNSCYYMKIKKNWCLHLYGKLHCCHLLTY